jgi:hypothetical protein
VENALKTDERADRETKRRISKAAVAVAQHQKLIAQLKQDGLPLLHAERYMVRLQARLIALKTALPEGTTYV